MPDYKQEPTFGEDVEVAVAFIAEMVRNEVFGRDSTPKALLTAINSAAWYVTEYYEAACDELAELRCVDVADDEESPVDGGAGEVGDSKAPGGPEAA